MVLVIILVQLKLLINFGKHNLIYLFLKFPIAFFYTESNTIVEEINTYFRALLSTNKKDKIVQGKKATIIIEIYKFLEKYLDFPKLKIPSINLNDTEKRNWKF